MHKKIKQPNKEEVSPLMITEIFLPPHTCVHYFDILTYSQSYTDVLDCRRGESFKWQISISFINLLSVVECTEDIALPGFILFYPYNFSI